MCPHKMRNRLFYAFLFFASFLRGDFEDHLRKAEGKGENHVIENIDFIYMINLDERPEKFQASLQKLQLYGITPYRFSAVNGWELSLQEIDDVGLKFSPFMEKGILGTRYPLDKNFEPRHETIERLGITYFCHCMARGTIGIALSHISILQDAYDSGYETIWVMEDDIDVVKNPHLISEMIEKLDDLTNDWDILFTDRDMRDANGNYVTSYYAGVRPDFIHFTRNNDYMIKTAVSRDFIKIGARSGAHSMILRRSGILKLLRFFKAHQIFFPYDMEYILPPGIQLYTVTEDIVTNLYNAASDNGAPNYKNMR